MRSVAFAPTGRADAAYIAANALLFPEFDELTSMFVERDGSGGNPGPGDTIGLVLNKAGMGGQTAEAYIAGLPELSDPDTQISFNATTSRNGAGFDLTSTGTAAQIATALNSVVPGDFYVLTFAWSGNTTARSIRGWVNGNQSSAYTTLSGSATIIVKAGSDAIERASVYIAGDTTGETFYLEITSLKRIPGGHLTAPADNQRPVLDLTNGVYSPVYDGVDDGLTYTFPGGAGPSDCSVFFAVKTSQTSRFNLFSATGASQRMFLAQNADATTDPTLNAGSPDILVSGVNYGPSISRDALHDLVTVGEWLICEVRGANLSGWSDIVTGQLEFLTGFALDGQLIGPIIVETSKLTNSLRRTIEQDLKRKAGIQ